jgi:uncharacterized protein
MEMSDFRFNVSRLLQEPVGSTRRYELDDEKLEVEPGRVVRPITGHVRLTRTQKGVLADAEVRGDVQLQCVRCLTDYEQSLDYAFSEEYYQTVVVNTGAALPKPEEPDVFLIDETHKLDLADAMREYALLNIPMLQLCREDCKGLCSVCGANLNEEECHCEPEETDNRLAALKQLLDRPKS